MKEKILLIDNDKDLRDSVQVMLKSSDYSLVEAVNCEEALILLAGEWFDLILLDITLPDKSGFQVLEFLKDNQLASKVIVITGTVGLKNAIESGTPVMHDYVTKPYNPTYLLSSIRHILSDRFQSNIRIQIIKAGDFIKSTPAGDLDMNASKEGLAQIAATGTDLHDYTVLIDLREVKSRLSKTDIYELASDLVEYGKTFRRKTAVLARADEDFGQATLFEDVAQHHGFRVKAFTVFEDAINWLSSITQLTENIIT